VWRTVVPSEEKLEYSYEDKIFLNILNIPRRRVNTDPQATSMHPCDVWCVVVNTGEKAD
jgi:hypothetical protein